MKLGVEIFFFKIPCCRTIFNFSSKTSGFFRVSAVVGRFSIFHAKLQVFAGLGALFGTFFCHFFMQNFSFLGGWEVFLSKKNTFFYEKLHVFGGLGALFGTFFVFFSCKISVFCEAGRSF